MFAQLFVLTLSAVLIAHSAAQSDFNFNDQQNGDKSLSAGGGGGGYSPFNRLPPQFIQDLNEGNRTLFFTMKANNTLTKGQILSVIQNWLQGLPQNVQDDYNYWQSNITTAKNAFVASIQANLSGDALTLFNQIQSIVDDQSLTQPQTCEQIVAAINASSPNATAQLHMHANANGFGQGGPGGPGDQSQNFGDGIMGASSGSGGQQRNICSSGPAAFHDGPDGGLNGWGQPPNNSTQNQDQQRQARSAGKRVIRQASNQNGGDGWQGSSGGSGQQQGSSDQNGQNGGLGSWSQNGKNGGNEENHFSGVSPYPHGSWSPNGEWRSRGTRGSPQPPNGSRGQNRK